MAECRILLSQCWFYNVREVPAPSSKPEAERHRRGLIIVLAVLIFLLFMIIFSQQAFNLTFLRPNSNQQTLILAALSSLIFLLFVALTFVLARTILKVYAERRGGVLGSKFRTRMVLGALLLSLAPVICLFVFAYGLMNRSIDKWFSRPVQEVQEQTSAVANLLTTYVANDVRAEARAIASSPDVQHAFQTGDFPAALSEFRRHEATMEGGFGFVLIDDHAATSYNAPETWPVIKKYLPAERDLRSARPRAMQFGGHEYMVGSAPVGSNGRILVALPLPANFSATLAQIEASEHQYNELSLQRKLVRQTYMGLLLLLTVLVLFASTWFALFLSKFVTRPVAALAAATEEISKGRLDYRVPVSGGDELGRLVQSFNRMAAELESNRQQLENSSQSLAQANAAVEQRRRQMEIILESIPTGVLSLDAQERVTRINTALTRIFDSPDARFAPGKSLESCFPADVTADLRPMLRKSERMGSVSNQLEITWERRHLDLAVTVSMLQVDRQKLGYVLVFEDLSDLLRAQKQAAWREVARRVAHEIKNPLTPIALSAERIRRHLERGNPPDAQSLAIVHGCAQTIAGAVDTVRTLVDEFSSLARFPAAQLQPADINAIVQSALSLFEGRLDGIKVQTELAPALPKVMADPEAMKRALANLVDNAAEAMRDSLLREIHISTALLGHKDMLEVLVSDTGHGVSQETKEKLFLPYFSTKKRGTGLGLAIVSRIIEDHHGSIRVEENLPVGARFILELPLAPEALPAENGAGKEVVSSGANS
jgi:nitrogen fixation/metabolism regulation signal transduction histidine kinase